MVDTIGFTFFDQQHGGTIGRLLGIDENDGIHAVWSDGVGIQKAQYNYYPPGGPWSWPDGVQIGNLNQSMYVSLSMMGNRFTIVTYQGKFLGDYHAIVGVEETSGSGNFQQFIISNPADQTIVEPQIVVSSDNVFHIIGYGAFFLDKRPLFYNRSEDYGISWLNEWVFVDSVRVLSASLTSAPNGKVALAWAHPINPSVVNPIEFVNNDLYLVESDDGYEWDFANPVNITDFIGGGQHPNSDTLRVYKDISTVYDNIYHLHIAYLCTGYYYDLGHMQTTPGAEIYHYSEATGFTKIAGKLYGETIPPENRRMFDKPSISFNYYAGDNNLYCVWCQFDDPNDVSQTGKPNGEIWGSYSDNNGGSWSEPINLTNTHSPGAPGGECLSEDFPSLSLEVNDTLHFSYILDYYPGISQGCQSDIIHHKISIDEFQYHAVGVEERIAPSIPTDFAHIEVFPNPFNSATTIILSLNHRENIELTVYDVNGRRVRTLYTGELDSGDYLFVLTADDLSNGIYFIRLLGGFSNKAVKLLLLK